MVKAVVIGAVNWDITLFTSHFPQKGEEVIVKRTSRVPGGKAGNVAVAAARLMGPGKAAIIAALGRDAMATEHVKIFRNEGVVVKGLKFSRNTECGHAYIVVDETGENLIHKYSGANATLTPEDLESPERRRLVAQSTLVTIMDPPFETALKLARNAKHMQKMVAWDPGVRSELGLEKTAGLLKNVDYFVANESETKRMTHTADHDSAARKLQEVNRGLKIITKLGWRGALFYHDKERTALEPLNLSSHGLKVVNTVGCGDAFMGAFVAALSEGRPDLEALRWANCAGGLKATRIETRGSPSRRTLLKYLD